MQRPQSVFNNQSETVRTNLRDAVARRLLHVHQAGAVEAVARDVDAPVGEGADSRISLVVLPTGAGKTGVAVLAAYACNAHRVLVVTPSETISRQVHAAFTYVHGRAIDEVPFLEKVGFFAKEHRSEYMPAANLVLRAADVRDAHSPLVILNAHKLGELSSVQPKDVPGTFSLVIVDEAHHYPAPTWLSIVDYFRQGTQILFLTATPERRGAPILSHPPCFTLARADAVARGIIRALGFREVGENHDDRPTQIAVRARRAKSHVCLYCTCTHIASVLIHADCRCSRAGCACGTRRR